MYVNNEQAEKFYKIYKREKMYMGVIVTGEHFSRKVKEYLDDINDWRPTVIKCAYEFALKELLE